LGGPVMPEPRGMVGQGRPPLQAKPPEEGSMAERSPRRLSTHQKAVLIQVLLAFPDETVAVRYLASASDALNYADDFSTIFKAVNWTVIAAESAEKLPYSSSGLAIEMRDEKLPPSAEALRDALRIYGIEAQVVSAPLNVREPINFVLAVTEP
jgi:hypothetical protein